MAKTIFIYINLHFCALILDPGIVALRSIKCHMDFWEVSYLCKSIWKAKRIFLFPAVIEALKCHIRDAIIYNKKSLSYSKHMYKCS